MYAVLFSDTVVADFRFDWVYRTSRYTINDFSFTQNIIYSDLIICTLAFTSAIEFFEISIWLLVIFAIAFGTATALFLPVVFALIPKIVPEEKLQSANAFSQVSMQLANTIAPAISGVLLSLYGAALVYTVMTMLFLISWILVFFLGSNADMKNESKERLTFKKFYREILEGIKIVIKRKMISVLLLISLLLNLSIVGPQQIGLPFIAAQISESGADVLGTLMSSLGLGTLTGVLSINLFNQYKNKFLLAVLMTALLGISWSLTGFFSSGLGLLLLNLFISGLFIGVLNVLIVTLIQSNTPETAIGRVMSLQLLSSTGIQPLTLLLVGSVLGLISVQSLFLISGMALILILALTLASKETRKILMR